MKVRVLLVLLLLAQLSPAYADTITTCPDQCGGYSNVQAAVNEASPGDTVALEPGVYRESIVLNKSITFVGSGDGTTLLGSGSSPVITVTADDVVIRDLRVGYCLFGVRAAEVKWLTLSGLGFTNCSVGVLIESCSRVEVESCKLTGSRYDAVKVAESANVTVNGCTFKDGEIGVDFERSGGNEVLQSTFEELGQGVILDESHQNQIIGNSFNGCVDAVVLSVSGGNTVEESEATGIDRFMASYLSMRNRATDNRVGWCIYAYESASQGNLYTLGSVNVTGSDYALALKEAEAPPGYEPVSDTLNVSLIPGTLVDGYAAVSVSIPEHLYIGREPGDMKLYISTGGSLHPVAQGYHVNATVRLNATIHGDGLYTLLLWRDTSPPTVAINANTTALTGETVRLDGSGSSDDVGVVGYAWSFGDGMEGAGESVTHIYPEPGVYNVTLTVSDEYGNIDEATHTVTVEEPSVLTTGNTLLYAVAGAVVIGAVAFLYLREKRYLNREMERTWDR
jgi:parallel beta-helix repeat protein